MNGIVLYIDDDEDNIFLVRRLFKRKRPDIQLHTAMTGHDGVRVAIDDQPALILLDNRLPDASGVQVLRISPPPRPPPRFRSSFSAATRTRRPSMNSLRRAPRISWASRSKRTSSWPSSAATSTDCRRPPTP